MIKRLEREQGCFARAAEDEPLFVLRAQDKLAPIIVRMWVMMARMIGCRVEKCDEALVVADEMESWPNRKWPGQACLDRETAKDIYVEGLEAGLRLGRWIRR